MEFLFSVTTYSDQTDLKVPNEVAGVELARHRHVANLAAALQAKKVKRKVKILNQ